MNHQDRHPTLRYPLEIPVPVLLSGPFIIPDDLRQPSAVPPELLSSSELEEDPAERPMLC